MFESMLSKDVVFSSCRQTLRDLRRLPMCPYTDWVFNNVDCHCNIRLGTLRLLIDDFINFVNYREFNPVRALTISNKSTEMFRLPGSYCSPISPRKI